MKRVLKYILLVNLIFAVYLFISWIVHTFTALPSPRVDGVIYPYSAYLLGLGMYFYPFVVLFFTLHYLISETTWRGYGKSLLIPLSYTVGMNILFWFTLVSGLTSNSAFWFGLVWVGFWIQSLITFGAVAVLSAVFVFGRNYLLPSLGLQKRKR